MEFAELLNPEAVSAPLKAGSKKQALQELAHLAANLTGLKERLIFDTLLERERLGTTGVGRGIAIPHGKLAELDRLHGLFARLEQPVDFDAIEWTAPMPHLRHKIYERDGRRLRLMELDSEFVEGIQSLPC